jgi:hypothetical protein
MCARSTIVSLGRDWMTIATAAGDGVEADATGATESRAGSTHPK